MKHAVNNILFVLLYFVLFSALSFSVLLSTALMPVALITGSVLFAFSAVKIRRFVPAAACACTFIFMCIATKDVDFSALSVLSYMLTGLVFTRLIKKQGSFGGMFLGLSITNMLYFLLLIYVTLQKTGIKISDFFAQTANNVSAVYKDALAPFASNPETAQAAKMLIESFDSFGEYFINILPSMFLITGGILSFFVIIFAKIKAFKLPLSNVPDFRFWRMDKTFGYLYIITMLCASFISTEPYSVVFMNLELVLTLVFTICGISLAEYFLRAKNVPAALSKIIVFLIFILSTLPLLSNLLGIIGFADAIFNLRLAIDRKMQTPPQSGEDKGDEINN